jgi:hypothetical protein
MASVTPIAHLTSTKALYLPYSMLLLFSIVNPSFLNQFGGREAQKMRKNHSFDTNQLDRGMEQPIGHQY